MHTTTRQHGTPTLEIARTVRFCINPPAAPDAPTSHPQSGANGFAGRPTMRGLGRHYALDIVCRGTPNPASGYLLNIKSIDAAARAAAVPAITDACTRRPWVDPAELLLELLPALVAAIEHAFETERSTARAAGLPPTAAGSLCRVRWHLTPTYSVEWCARPSPPGQQGQTMNQNAAPDTAGRRIVIRQQFDFAAAHRLHVADLDGETNARLFGKCNNPAGHGHNYRVEPAIEVPVLTGSGPTLPLEQIERIVDEQLIQPFDHTNLNADTEAFGPGGLNPSVEHIAMVFFERLAPAIERAAAGAVLRRITVWETDRTCCTYPAEG